ncbi:MAG: hypothetical protein ACJAS6_001088 [Rickettsiales bacterium]|jgi:hypothetical protein
MFHRKLLVLIFFAIQFAIQLISINSFAFSIEELEEDYSQDFKPLQVSGDAIKWEIFAKTVEKTSCITDAEGFDDCVIKPVYSSKIKALNNKRVTLTGFMFPLDMSDKQKNFLIGPYPASCPFNYHIGPSQVVEVRLNKAIEFSYDPVTVRGVLSLKYNEETGVFYYLNPN